MTTTKTRPAPVVAFDFSSDVIDTFTAGDCWKLAQLVNAEAGFTIVTMSDNHDGWCHVANLLPGGLILDIEGIWETEAWIEKWEIWLLGETRYIRQWVPSEFEADIKECGFSPFLTEKENLSYAQKVIALSGIPSVS